jgi:hypothetical protein
MLAEHSAEHSGLARRAPPRTSLVVSRRAAQKKPVASCPKPRGRFEFTRFSILQFVWNRSNGMRAVTTFFMNNCGPVWDIAERQRTNF